MNAPTYVLASPGIGVARINFHPISRFDSGYISSSRFAIASISAWACWMLTPGASRPPINIQEAPRCVKESSVLRGWISITAVIGAHSSGLRSVVPRKPRRRDADDGERRAVEDDWLAGDRPVGVESPPPQPVAQHGHRRCAWSPVIVGREEPSEPAA